MKKCIGLLLLMLCVSFLSFSNVMADDAYNCSSGQVYNSNIGSCVSISGSSGDSQGTGSEFGCLPAMGHAGIDSIPILRITLVDQNGNKKKNTETVDFLFKGSEDVLEETLGEDKTASEYIKSLLEAKATVHDSKVKFSYKNNNGEIINTEESKFINTEAQEKIGLKVFQTYKKDTPVSAIEIDDLKISDKYIDFGDNNSIIFDNGSSGNSNFVYKVLMDRINSGDVNIAQQIKEIVLTLYNNNVKNYDVSDTDYLILEPVYIWMRGDFYYVGDTYFFGETAGYKYERRKCYYAGVSYVYGTVKEIFGYEQQYIDDYPAVKNPLDSSQYKDGNLAGNNHLWTNTTYLYDSLYGMYMSKETTNEPWSSIVKNMGFTLISGNKSTTDLSKEYLNDELGDFTKTTYGMGLVSFAALNKNNDFYCRLYSDQNTISDTSIAVSNYNHEQSLCCNSKRYKNNKISVYYKNSSGEDVLLEENLSNQKFSSTTFYKKYCSTPHVCEVIDGKYYGNDGVKVSKDVYEKECEATTKNLPVIYRTISLSNPFLYKKGTDRPLSRFNNWYDETKEPATVGNYKATVIDNSIKAYDSNSPKYTINLNVSKIKKIREFNKSNIYSKESNCTFLCNDENGIVDINTVKSIGCSC